MEQNVLKIVKESDKVVGSKQVLKGIEDGTIRCVVVASDADEFILTKLKSAAKAKGIKVMSAPSMAELGKACGIEVGSAVAGIK